MERVLITGGAGFIGLHLAEKWLHLGASVDLVDNLSRGKLDKDLSLLLENPNLRLISADLSALDSLPRSDYTYIYHLAAIIGVKHVMECPFEVLRFNAELTFHLLDLIQKQQIRLKRFLYASTSEVYAGTLQYFTLPIPTSEESPLALSTLNSPRTSYMLSKLYGEALCIHSGVPYTIFRPHNVYGPRMGMSHVIPELLKKAHHLSEKDSLPVYSPGHTRTFCYISDAVDMLADMAVNAKCECEILNLGQQKPEISMEKLAGIVLTSIGKANGLALMEDTPGSPVRRCPDMRKTTSLLGKRESISLKDGIQKTYTWYREHY